MTWKDDLIQRFRDAITEPPTPERCEASFYVLGHAARIVGSVGESGLEWMNFVSGWELPGRDGSWEVELRVRGRLRWRMEVRGIPGDDSYRWTVSENYYP